MFIYPVDGAKLTSPFGKDILNGVARVHNGIDLAKTGTVTIKAAAAGTVSRSYRSDSYGEVIFVVHNLGGQVYETVYAHMQTGSRRVAEGASVKQGQALGLMGNTGYSFGQHLHFELHVGRWNGSKSNAVDPLQYLGKASVSKSTGKTLSLPASESSWRVYPVGKAPVKGNEVAKLNPKKFGGLKYDILDNPAPDVYTIKTGDFGTVNIYAGKETGAKVSGKAAAKAKPKQYVQLPKSASSWRAYPLSKAPTKGNEVASLNPAKFGGLEYEVLRFSQPNVAVIKTQQFGEVQIYVAASTGAKLVSK